MAAHLGKALPALDFNARVAWWRERWRKELAPVVRIVLAEQGGKLAGFVTVDPKTMYLDQIVVAPELWGSDVALALLDEAKRLSPEVSTCSSTRIIFAPSAFTKSTALSMPAKTKTLCRE